MEDYPNQPELDPELIFFKRWSAAIAAAKLAVRETGQTPQDEKKYADMSWYLAA